MSTALILIDTRPASAAVQGRPYTPNDYRIMGGSAFLALTNRAGDVVAEVQVDVADLDVALTRRWSLHLIEHKSGTQFVYARNN